MSYLLDEVGHGLDVARPLIPRWDDRVLEPSQGWVLLEEALEQSEAAARCGDGKLGVEGQYDQLGHTVPLDLWSSMQHQHACTA